MELLNLESLSLNLLGDGQFIRFRYMLSIYFVFLIRVFSLIQIQVWKNNIFIQDYLDSYLGLRCTEDVVQA